MYFKIIEIKIQVNKKITKTQKSINTEKVHSDPEVKLKS